MCDAGVRGWWEKSALLGHHFCLFSILCIVGGGNHPQHDGGSCMTRGGRFGYGSGVALGVALRHGVRGFRRKKTKTGAFITIVRVPSTSRFFCGRRYLTFTSYSFARRRLKEICWPAVLPGTVCPLFLVLISFSWCMYRTLEGLDIYCRLDA